MKKLLLPIVLILGTTQLFAAKWRVNNNAGVNANFTDFPAAVASTSVLAGDTIYLEPSATTYSGATIGKSLVIIGNGYFNNTQLAVNNTGLQANMQDSKLGTMIFDLGTSGSCIMGVTFTSFVHLYDDSITVKRNLFSGSHLYINNRGLGATYRQLSGLDIRQNVFVGVSNYSAITTYDFSTTGGGSFSNVSIQNNIFYGYYAGVYFPVGLSGFVQNNVFDACAYYGLTAYSFQVNNNVMVAGAVFVPNNCVYLNNIGAGTQFGMANGNQQNVTTTALFTNYSGATQTETRYVLSPTGPGIAAGFGSADVGIFGGGDPYKLSGIPPVPTIYSLTAPAATTSTSLPVTISTRSND